VAKLLILKMRKIMANHNYGGFVNRANRLLKERLVLPSGYSYRWAGEYEFELRAKERLKLILPIVFFVIFLLLYIVFKSATEAAVLIFPTLYAMSGGLLLQWALGYNFSVAVWVGYIALFGIAVETGVVMVVYLHEAFQHRLAEGKPLTDSDLEEATKTTGATAGSTQLGAHAEVYPHGLNARKSNSEVQARRSQRPKPRQKGHQREQCH
jgi:Cu/Ag efflux pump CusA